MLVMKNRANALLVLLLYRVQYNDHYVLLQGWAVSVQITGCEPVQDVAGFHGPASQPAGSPGATYAGQSTMWLGFTVQRVSPNQPVSRYCAGLFGRTAGLPTRPFRHPSWGVGSVPQQVCWGGATEEAVFSPPQSGVQGAISKLSEEAQLPEAPLLAY